MFVCLFLLAAWGVGHQCVVTAVQQFILIAAARTVLLTAVLLYTVRSPYTNACTRRREAKRTTNYVRKYNHRLMLMSNTKRVLYLWLK